MGKFLRHAVLIGALIVLVVVVPSATQASNAAPVVVGPGNAEDTVRGVVRTAGNVVYIFAPDDTAQRQNTGPGVIRAWKGNAAGNPTAFAEMDAAHHPNSTGTTHTMYAPDVRLDRNGVAKMVYVDQATTNLYYNTFSTVTDTWGTPVQLGTGSLRNPGFYSQPNYVFRNWASYGLTLDNSDQPHVVYCSDDNVYSRDYANGTWTAPQLVATGTGPIHVQLAMDSHDNTWAAWMDNPVGPTGSTSIRVAERSAATGAWGPVQVIDAGSPNVLTGKTDDQGPSIIVNSSGVPYVMYLSGTVKSGWAVSTASVRYLSNGSWVNDDPPSSAYQVTHSPQLYGAGQDAYFFLGHDVKIHFGYMYQLGGQSWSPYTVLDSTAKIDGSASVRWDPARDNNPGVIDVIHHDETYLAGSPYFAQLYYQAVPSSSATDTTPPTVSLTSPADGSTVSGTVTFSANASDNVAVASVRFQVDGATFATVTAAPYQATWDSTTVADGAHVFTAVATDTSGNAASSQASVTVSNSRPPSISSTWPTDGATDQASTVAPRAVFSGAVDASTVNTSTFTLTGPSGNVAGSVSYDSSSFTATLTPSQRLQPGASYTASINGVNGADGSTVPLASWSFTIATSCPCSLMTGLSPTAVHLSTRDGRPGPGPFSYELGTKVQVSSPTQLTAIRFYKDSQETGSHTGNVWSSNGSLLSQTTFNGESASGWQSQALSTPVSLQPGQTYIVSVNINAFFVETPGGLANQLTNPPVQSVVGSNGVFGSSGGTFPAGTYKSNNYFVDLVVGG